MSSFAFDPKKAQVLMIGTTRHPKLKYPEVPAVVANINSWAAELMAPDFLGIPPGNIHPLMDWPRGAILERCEEVADVCGDQALFLYYAGHAVPGDNSVELLIPTVDTSATKGGALRADEALKLRSLLDILQGSKAQFRFVMLDTCYSGRLAKTLGNDLRDQMRAAIQEVDERRGGWVAGIASANAYDPALAQHSNGMHTAFTGEWLEVCRQGVPDKGEILTLNDLFQALTASLTRKKCPEPVPVHRPMKALPFCRNRAHVPGTPRSRAKTAAVSAPLWLRSWNDWDAHVPDRGAHRCAKLVRRCDIYWPSGDVVTTNIMVELRPEDPKEALASIPLMRAKSASLTHANFEVTVLDGTYQLDLKVERQHETYVGIGSFTPKVRANRPVTLRAESIDYGVVHPSRQSQEWMGVDSDLGHEELKMTFRTRVEQAVFLVTFCPDPDPDVDIHLDRYDEMIAEGVWFPKDVELTVTDPEGNALPAEQPTIAWGYALHDEYLSELAHDVPIPAASFTINRPQLLHHYILTWKIPTYDIADKGQRVTLARCRASWRSRAQSHSGSPRLKAFLEECRKLLRFPDEELYLGLYSVNDTAHTCERLACIGCPEGVADRFLLKSEAWGKGFIGRAARRPYEVIEFDRSTHKPTEGEPEPPADCTALLATGLAFKGLSGVVPAAFRIYGVVAVGSAEPNSSLLTLDAIDPWIDLCQTLGAEILGGEKRPPGGKRD